MQRIVWVCLFSLIARVGAPTPLRAQRTAPDSSAAVCLNVTWLDASSVCGGRVANTASLSVLGALSGALSGYVGGTLLTSACLGHGETAAARGAVVGATAGLIAGAVLPQVSRRALASRHAAQRAHAVHHPERAWSWRALRPAVLVIGGSALGGAAIGAARGAQSPACAAGVANEGARGAGVYAAGSLATMGGALLAVRWLF